MPNANPASGIPTGSVRLLLCAGVLLAPLFYAVILIQLVTREGFLFTVHPISLLELGPYGWVQSWNFGICGILSILFSVGLARNKAPRFIAALFLLSGIGLALVAVFPPDPYKGFPPGMPMHPGGESNHSKLHGLGFLITFVPLIVAGLLVGLRVRRQQPGFSVISILACCLVPVIIGSGFAAPGLMSIAFFAAGIIALGWMSIFALTLLQSRAVSAASGQPF